MLTPQQLKELNAKYSQQYGSSGLSGGSASAPSPQNSLRGRAMLQNLGLDETGSFNPSAVGSSSASSEEEGGALNAVKNFGIGAAKGLGSTIMGAAELGSKALEKGYDATIGRLTGTEAQKGSELAREVQEEHLTPEGTAQKAGFATEQIGEFFVPGAAGLKGTKALQAVKAAQGAEKAVGAAKYLPRLAQMITEATPQLLLSSAHEGKVTPGNVVSSAAGGVMSAAGKLPQLALGGVQGAKGAYDIAKGDFVSGVQNLGFGALGLYGGVKSKGILLDQPLAQALTKTQQLSGESTAKQLPAYTGNWLQRLGKRIQTSVMKPSSADIDAGFNVNNVAKYDVGGTLPESYGKVSTRIAGYGDKLNEIKEKFGDPMVIDLREALINTQRELLGRAKNLRQKDLNTALTRLEDELTSFLPEWKERKVSFLDGWRAKAAAGEEAAFHHDPLKAKSQGSEEQVFNTFYTQLRKQLETNAPDAYKEVNVALSELIPIRNAILRRMPIDERNNVVGVLDLISAGSAALSPKAAPLFLVSRLSKSGKFADILMKLGSQDQPNLVESIPEAPRYPALPEGKTIYGERAPLETELEAGMQQFREGKLPSQQNP